MTADLYVGIDPGKTGGIVVLNRSGAYTGHTMMPLVGKGTKRERPSLALLRDWWSGIAHPDRRVLVAIERVASMPTDGPRQAFAFGKAHQVCFDFADLIGASVTEVAPRDWQKVWLRGHAKGGRAQIKASAALVAGERWPELVSPLERKNKWGLADAALVAATARLIDNVNPELSP